MSAPLQTVPHEVTVLEAARIMREKNIRRLVVVDDDGNMCGLTTQSDIIKELEAKYIDTLKQIIRQQDVRLDSLENTSMNAHEATVYLESILRCSVDMGVIALDLTFHVVYFNPAAEAILGCSADEVVGRYVESIPAFRDRSLIRAEGMSKIIGEYKRETFVFELEKEGNTRAIQSRVSGIWEGTGRLFGFVLMLHDITEQKRAEEELAHMATHDSLTGLPNRAFFHDLIAIEAKRARREMTRFAVLFLDLDGFKTINDTLGHGVGDELLLAVSKRVTDVLRRSDTVARIGGDEFVVLLPGIIDWEKAEGVAQKIVDSIQDAFSIEGHEVRITASVGVAVYPDDSDNARELIEYADMAMYGAKNQGKNRYYRFLPEMLASVSLQLLSDMPSRSPDASRPTSPCGSAETNSASSSAGLALGSE